MYFISIHVVVLEHPDRDSGESALVKWFEILIVGNSLMVIIINIIIMGMWEIFLWSLSYILSS